MIIQVILEKEGDNPLDYIEFYIQEKEGTSELNPIAAFTHIFNSETGVIQVERILTRKFVAFREGR